MTVDTANERLSSLQYLTRSVMAILLEAGDGPLPTAHDLGLASAQEAGAFLEDLQSAQQQGQVSLTPELRLALEFLLLCRTAGATARQHGTTALSVKLSEDDTPLSPQQQELKAIVLYRLGVEWRCYAAQQPFTETTALRKARNCFDQSLQTFRQAQRPDLESRFINALGETLLQLRQWDELAALAQQGIELHTQYAQELRLIYNYVLLGEVYLARQEWLEAETYAIQGLQCLRQIRKKTPTADPAIAQLLPWAWQTWRNWLLLLQGIANFRRGELANAIGLLESARFTDSSLNPGLYNRILGQLSLCYFSNQQFLAAFRVRQDLRQFKRRFDLANFVEAVPLPPRQVAHPPLPLPPERLQPGATLSLAPGRASELAALHQRLQNPACRLTIVHGPPRSGKTSLLQAGLYPLLADTHRVITLQDYQDWLVSLGQQILPSFLPANGITNMTTSAMAENWFPWLRDLLSQGSWLICCDQLERLYREPLTLEQRQVFYAFLQICLEVPSVHVMLVLPEELLHVLLEWDRWISLGTIATHFCDRQLCFWLDYLTPINALAAITELTQIPTSRYPFEPELMQAIVQDLTREQQSIHPQDLQIVGHQLQAEQVHTLAQYQQCGGKVALWQRYLAQILSDCGEGQSHAALNMLCSLTSADGSCLPRNQADLIAGQENRKDLLQILTAAGLLLPLPQRLHCQYQLAYPELVPWIRQQAGLPLDRPPLPLPDVALPLPSSLTVSNVETPIALTPELLDSGLSVSVDPERSVQELTGITTSNSTQDQEQLATPVAAAEQTTPLQNIWKLTIATIAAVALGAGLIAILQGWQRRVEQQRLAEIAQVHDRASQIPMMVQNNQQLEALRESLRLVRRLWALPSISPEESQPLEQAMKVLSLQIREVQRVQASASPVHALTFSPEGDLWVTGHGDGSLQLWQLSGKKLTTLSGHQAAVTAVQFLRDGRTLVSGSADGTLKFWSLLSGEPQKTIATGQEQILGLSQSGDGQRLATAGANGDVKLWDTAGQPVGQLPRQASAVTAVAWSADNQMIATATRDGQISIWQGDGKRLGFWPAHTGRVSSLVFNPETTMLVSGGEDRSVKLWKPNGKLQRSHQDHTAAVTALAFSPDGQRFASASDRTIVVRDLDGQPSQSFRGSGEVLALQFNAEQPWLASAGQEGVIQFWFLGDSQIFFAENPDTLTSWQNLFCHWGWNYLLYGVAIPPEDRTLCQGTGETAQTLIARSANLLNQGAYPDGLQVYLWAAQRYGALQNDQQAWFSLCLNGLESGFLRSSLLACNRMVTLEPKPGRYRGIRGILRALLGDRWGAAIDFEAALAWGDQPDTRSQYTANSLQRWKQQRLQWISELRAGKTPITTENLSQLVELVPVASPPPSP